MPDTLSRDLAVELARISHKIQDVIDEIETLRDRVNNVVGTAGPSAANTNEHEAFWRPFYEEVEHAA